MNWLNKEVQRNYIYIDYRKDILKTQIVCSDFTCWYLFIGSFLYDKQAKHSIVPSRQIADESQKNNIRATSQDIALMLFC